MVLHVIRITEFNNPMPGVRRQMGRTNVGVYCHSCHEFIALAVLAEGSEIEYEFVANRPIPIYCSSCGHIELRQATEITQLDLTELNVREHQ